MRHQGEPAPAAAQAIRMVADAAMLLTAFVSGVAVDYFWRVEVRHQTVPAFSTYLARLLPTLPLLIVTGLLVLWISGFYSRRRFYRNRYKAVAIVQGSALTFLLFTSEAYVMRAYVVFPGAVAIAVAAGVSLALSLILRVYTHNLVQWLQAPPKQVAISNPHGDQPIILVIGGAGYVGSALLPQLLDAGYKVRVLDSLLFGKQPIARYLQEQSIELFEGDFRRIDQLVTAMRDVDSVIHLGGLVGDPACALDEELTIEINLTSTRAVAEVAKAHGVRRFIFASTCSVYGASDALLDERSILQPVSLYAKSKVASERELQALTDEVFKPTILRFGTVYGLSGRTRFDLVVNLLTAKAIVDGVITVYGPDQWRPFVHVSDVAKAVLCALQAPEDVARGRVFNVGSNSQNVTLGQLGALVKQHVPSADLLISAGDGDRRNYRVSFDRIAEELEFVPEWTLDRGIEQVLGFLAADGMVHYSASQFSNVTMIKNLMSQEDVEADRRRHLRLLESSVGFEDYPPSGNMRQDGSETDHNSDLQIVNTRTDSASRAR